MNELVLTNARIVTEDAILDGTVVVRGGAIEAVERGLVRLPAAIDCDGDYVIPGLVELHTDNLERHFKPRPKVVWPPAPAVLAHDAELAAAGITTVYDALSIADLSQRTGQLEHLDQMIGAIGALADDGRLRCDHRLHLRCEITFAHVLELYHRFVEDRRVALVSLMDHTPGQRQFVDVEVFRHYYKTKYRMTDAEIDHFVAERRAALERFGAAFRTEIAADCRRRAIPLASHDDATPAHVAEAHGEGCVIAEFPTTVEAAAAARAAGLAVLMGAPNVVLGGSHSGNVAASSLAEAGHLDLLSSDYVPASALQAVFDLHRAGACRSLPAAVALVTANPARVAGLADRGRIARGLRADLVRVATADGAVATRAVWVGGDRIA